MKIKKINGTYYVYSWTTGCTPLKVPKLKSEADILAYALYLEHIGLVDEADIFLYKHCS